MLRLDCAVLLVLRLSFAPGGSALSPSLQQSRPLDFSLAVLT